MKRLCPAVVLALLVGACDDYRKPQPDGPPGGSDVPGVGNGATLGAGQFAVTLIENAPFFNEMPIGQVMPDMVLPKETSVRVIAPGELYCKVELDNGRVGYVMAIHLVGLTKTGKTEPGGDVPPPPVGGTGAIDPHLPPIEPGQ